jgi:integrase
MVSSRFVRLSAKAGLPRIVLHGLRHSYATNALEAGVEVITVSKRLGHSRSYFTADTYMRLPESLDRDAAELVATRMRQEGLRAASGEAT